MADEIIKSELFFQGVSVSNRDLLVRDTSQNLISDIIINSEYLGTNYQESGMFVKPSVNLYDLFVNTHGRLPLPNDVVNYRVEYNVAIVGFADITNAPTNTVPMLWLAADNKMPAGIVVGDNWPLGAQIKLINNGWIFGAGGDGGQVTPTIIKNGTEGLPAILGGNIPLFVDNYGTIYSGGGGGGAAASDNSPRLNRRRMGGGGGAPYGKGSTIVESTYTFTTYSSMLIGGWGLSDYGTNFVHYATSGDGGDWAWKYNQPPGDGIGKDGSPLSHPDTGLGALSGYLYIGDVNITNISGGITKGR